MECFTMKLFSPFSENVWEFISAHCWPCWLATETEFSNIFFQKPIEGIQEITAGNMCCKSGQITGHIALPQRGFTSGQNIPFLVKINNKSKTNLRNVRVTLNQVSKGWRLELPQTVELCETFQSCPISGRSNLKDDRVTQEWLKLNHARLHCPR